MNITTILSKTVTSNSGNPFDELRQFCKTSLKKHRKIFHLSVDASPDVLVVIKISHSKILRLGNKLGDQVSEGDSLWLVTSKDWQEFKILLEEAGEVPMRGGKPVPYLHPTSMSKNHIDAFIKVFTDKEELRTACSSASAPKITQDVHDFSEFSNLTSVAGSAAITDSARASLLAACPVSERVGSVRMNVGDLGPRDSPIHTMFLQPADPSSSSTDKPSRHTAQIAPVSTSISEPVSVPADLSATVVQLRADIAASHAEETPMESSQNQGHDLDGFTLDSTNFVSPQPLTNSFRGSGSNLDLSSSVGSSISGAGKSLLQNNLNRTIDTSSSSASSSPSSSAVQSPLNNTSISFSNSSSILSKSARLSPKGTLLHANIMPKSFYSSVNSNASSISNTQPPGYYSSPNLGEGTSSQGLSGARFGNSNGDLTINSNNSSSSNSPGAAAAAARVEAARLAELEEQLGQMQSSLAAEREEKESISKGFADKLRAKEAEMEEMLRVQAALQGRLEETRFMLKIFASNIGASGSGSRGGGGVSLDSDDTRGCGYGTPGTEANAQMQSAVNGIVGRFSGSNSNSSSGYGVGNARSSRASPLMSSWATENSRVLDALEATVPNLPASVTIPVSAVPMSAVPVTVNTVFSPGGMDSGRTDREKESGRLLDADADEEVHRNRNRNRAISPFMPKVRTTVLAPSSSGGKSSSSVDSRSERPPTVPVSTPHAITRVTLDLSELDNPPPPPAPIKIPHDVSLLSQRKLNFRRNHAAKIIQRTLRAHFNDVINGIINSNNIGSNSNNEVNLSSSGELPPPPPPLPPARTASSPTPVVAPIVVSALAHHVSPGLKEYSDSYLEAARVPSRRNSESEDSSANSKPRSRTNSGSNPMREQYLKAVGDFSTPVAAAPIPAVDHNGSINNYLSLSNSSSGSYPSRPSQRSPPGGGLLSDRPMVNKAEVSVEKLLRRSELNLSMSSPKQSPVPLSRTASTPKDRVRALTRVNSSNKMNSNTSVIPNINPKPTTTVTTITPVREMSLNARSGGVALDDRDVDTEVSAQVQARAQVDEAAAQAAAAVTAAMLAEKARVMEVEAAAATKIVEDARLAEEARQVAATKLAAQVAAAKLAEEERIAAAEVAAAKLAEEERIAAAEVAAARLAEEERFAAAEVAAARLAEEERFAAAEVAAAKLAEEARLAEVLAVRARAEAEAAAASEAAKLAEEKRVAEAARQAEAAAVAAKLAEEAAAVKLVEEQRVAEETRQAEAVRAATAVAEVQRAAEAARIIVETPLSAPTAAQLLQSSQSAMWFGYKFESYRALCSSVEFIADDGSVTAAVPLTPIEVYYAPYLRALRVAEYVQTVVASRGSNVITLNHGNNSSDMDTGGGVTKLLTTTSSATTYGTFDTSQNFMSLALTAVPVLSSPSISPERQEWHAMEYIMWALFQVYGKMDGILVKTINLSQIMSILKDCKLLAPATSTTSAFTSAGITNSFLQLQYKKATLTSVPHAVVIQSKTGSVKKAVKATSSDSGSGLTFQQFLVFMETMSSTIYEYYRQHQQKAAAKKTTAVAAPSSPHVEEILFAGSVPATAVVSSPDSPGASVDTAAVSLHTSSELSAYSYLHSVLYKVCLKHSKDQGLDDLLEKTRICRSGMTRAAKTAFASSGSVLFLDASYPSTDEFDSSESVNARMPQLWTMNSEQLRQIFGFYSRSVDLNRHGKLKLTPAGAMATTTVNAAGMKNEKEAAVVATKMANFDNVKDCLVDFGVVPKYVDHSTFIKLFRSVKLWEWSVGEKFLIDRMTHTLAQQQAAALDNAAGGGAAGENGGGVAESVQNLSQVINLDATHVISEVVPFDYSVSLGNLSITACGFVELLARISCLGKFATIPASVASAAGGDLIPSVATIETLLRIMDSSGGKEKLIRSNRGSVAVRAFKFMK